MHGSKPAVFHLVPRPRSLPVRAEPALGCPAEHRQDVSPPATRLTCSLLVASLLRAPSSGRMTIPPFFRQVSCSGPRANSIGPLSGVDFRPLRDLCKWSAASSTSR